MRFFTAAALIAPLAALAVAQDATPLTTEDKTPDVVPQTCPPLLSHPSVPPAQGKVWAPDMTGNLVSDDKVFFLSPGLGACGFNYTDTTPVVCLSPGNINADPSPCNALIELTLLTTGITTYGRVGDMCGNVPNSTFGCNDLYVSKILFTTLANGNSSLLDAGNLMGNVSWRKIGEENMPEANKTTDADLSPLTKIFESTYKKEENYQYSSSEKSTSTWKTVGDASNMVGGLLGGNKGLLRRRGAPRA